MTSTKTRLDFYYDTKYHWIVNEGKGDRVCDPEYWAKLFKLKEMYDGAHYLETYINDATHGSLRMCIEVIWEDGMVHEVNLTAPDGDPVKEGVTSFHAMVSISN